VRIIRGEYKGRAISPPKNFKARPTTDFAKENIFNVIDNYFYFEDLEVLDLFSGTGSISYEFASRGSKSIDLVELNQKHYSFIRQTIEKLNIDTIRTIRGNAIKFIETCAKQYDIIFADPPYDMEGIENLPKIVFERDLIKPGGWFILEHSKKIKLPYSQNIINHREYGSVNFTIYSKEKS